MSFFTPLTFNTQVRNINLTFRVLSDLELEQTINKYTQIFRNSVTENDDNLNIAIVEGCAILSELQEISGDEIRLTPDNFRELTKFEILGILEKIRGVSNPKDLVK
jgi:hypothetical protein